MADEKTTTTAPKASAPAAKEEPKKADTSASEGKAETADAPADYDRNAELAKLGVDHRLDNRLGDQRPELVEWPAKPQQIDGPEITEDWSKHARSVRKDVEKLASGADFEPAGAKSEGPHGLGPEGVTVGDDHGKPLTK